MIAADWGAGTTLHLRFEVSRLVLDLKTKTQMASNWRFAGSLG